MLGSKYHTVFVTMPLLSQTAFQACLEYLQQHWTETVFVVTGITIFWSTLYMINIYLSQKGNHSTWLPILDEWPLCLLVRAGLQPPAVQKQVCLHWSFPVNFQYFWRQGEQCLPKKESMITLCCKSLKSKSKQKKYVADLLKRFLPWSLWVQAQLTLAQILDRVTFPGKFWPSSGSFRMIMIGIAT